MIVANSPRALLELILLEKWDDIATFLPEHLIVRGNEMKEKLAILFKETDMHYFNCSYCRHKIRKSKKVFCIAANDSGWFLDPLIFRFLGKCKNAKDYFQNSRKILMALLDLLFLIKL